MSPPPSELKGILVALIMLFTLDRKEIDVEALDKHINQMIDAGVHGLVPGGSTGEFTVLSVEERKQLVEQCVKSAAGIVPVLAGIGDLSTERAIELAVHAVKAGAVSLMVVPPFYDAPSLGELHEFLGEIHRESGLPIVYHNIPSASGLKLSPEEISGLSKVGVKYLKDTSGNGPELNKLLLHRQDQITAFNGWDTLTFYGLAAGAKGSVWGATNIIAELSMELWDAIAVTNDIKRGRELWSKIWPVCNVLENGGNYSAAVKTGMQLRRWSTDGLRKPLALLQGERKNKLAAALKGVDEGAVELTEVDEGAVELTERRTLGWPHSARAKSSAPSGSKVEVNLPPMCVLRFPSNYLKIPRCPSVFSSLLSASPVYTNVSSGAAKYGRSQSWHYPARRQKMRSSAMYPRRPQAGRKHS